MVFRIFFIFILIFFSSCEKYIPNTKTFTLSGKYKLALLDVTSVDQNVTLDSLYRPGSIYVNHNLPKPFDSLVINRFYIHLDYSSIRLNLVGVTADGRDLWEYGNADNPIFYSILSNNSYYNAFLRFDYISESMRKTLVFIIEDDGFESLQLQSSGSWAKGKYGEKQVMTFVLTRVGP